jgi:hypothetical protein
MSLAHVIDEVFADTPPQGNQLAVFEDGPALSGDQMQRLPCALRVRDLSGCGHPPWRRPTGRGVTAAVLLRSGPSAVDQAARRDDGAAVRSADHALRLMPASRSWASRPAMRLSRKRLLEPAARSFSSIARWSLVSWRSRCLRVVFSAVSRWSASWSCSRCLPCACAGPGWLPRSATVQCSFSVLPPRPRCQ